MLQNTFLHLCSAEASQLRHSSCEIGSRSTCFGRPGLKNLTRICETSWGRQNTHSQDRRHILTHVYETETRRRRPAGGANTNRRSSRDVTEHSTFWRRFSPVLRWRPFRMNRKEANPIVSFNMTLFFTLYHFRKIAFNPKTYKSFYITCKMTLINRK